MRRFYSALFTTMRGRRRRLGLLAAVLGTASLIVIAIASADNVGGFEIDADHATADHALYSGNDGGADWAQGSSNTGIFIPSASAPHTAATDLYGSNIDQNPAASGASALIGDGNSDTRFRSTEPEQNAVSPSGKSPDDVWPIGPSNVRPKNDFSHAYVHASVVDSPCDPDPDVEDVVLHLGGHVGDNEGDHFWGFEFMRNKPGRFDDLKANNGSSFNLDFDRQIGDVLISFTIPGNDAEQPLLEIFKVTGFGSNNSAVFTLAGAQAGCPTTGPNPQPQGFSLLATNNVFDVKAPPWNVPVCDPTADNGANQCRLANGNGLTPNEDLLADADFAEASVDLQAFGISPCFTNVVFSSRSAHVLNGADVADVGGADFPLCGKKSGTKFHDRDADGQKETGEEGLPNWQIKLYRDADGDKVLDSTETAGAQSTMTGSDGSYQFSDLQNGDYIVCEVKQSGWNQSLPNSSSSDKADCSVDSTLGAVGRAFKMTGADHTGNDFGNYQNATKQGTKFDDLNGNGVKNIGEPGIPNVQIHIFGTTGLGATIHDHATTDANGNYTLSVPPGSYTVCETPPPGYTQSFPSSGADCSAHTGVTGAKGYAITLTSGQVDADNHFGNFANATKRGTKFVDLDGDGADRELGEPGLAGVQIHIFGTTGLGATVHDHATTDANGNYTLSVPPGTYTVCETPQPGYTQSFPSSGADCSAHTGVPGARGYAITLTSGQIDSGNNFGNFRNASITGTKFKDADASGSRQTGEIGLSGWEIHLFGTDGRGNTVHQHANTDANGNYSFSVAPGSYTLCETTSGKTGWVQSFPTEGANCTGHTVGAGGATITPGPVGHAITVNSGGSRVRDFGNTPLSRARITFEPLADLPNGSDATRATRISCTDKNGASVGAVDNSNTLTTNDVKTNQNSLTCIVSFVDP
jgi:hypothetical protein